MRYAQSGIRGYVPPAGACVGHRYEERADPSDEHMSVDCARCEPYLAKDPLWAGSVSEVPLTDKEQRAADEAERKSTQVASMAVANLASLFGAAAANPEALTVALKGVADQADVLAEPAAAKRAVRPRKAAAKTPVSA